MTRGTENFVVAIVCFHICICFFSFSDKEQSDLTWNNAYDEQITLFHKCKFHDICFVDFLVGYGQSRHSMNVHVFFLYSFIFTESKYYRKLKLKL